MSAREEVEEGVAGGGSGPYLDGEGGGEEVWLSKPTKGGEWVGDGEGLGDDWTEFYTFKHVQLSLISVI